MLKKYLPVIENPNYVQDSENFALLYNNELEFKNFESRKHLNERVDNLEMDIQEIKNLLKILVNGNN